MPNLSRTTVLDRAAEPACGAASARSAALMTRRKLLFYISSLEDGGAERVWALLASDFARQGYDVVLAVDFEDDGNRSYLDASVRYKVLGGSHLATVRRLAVLLRDERPDCVLAGLGGSNLKLALAMALARTGAKAIISYHGFEEYKTGLLSWLTYAALPVLSRITEHTVCVSDALKDALQRRWGASRRRTIRIYNPVFVPQDIAPVTTGDLAARENIVLAVGRLSKEKDFSTLIRAMALISQADARLVILGDGPERATLEVEIARMGLGDRVSLLGYHAAPWGWYARAKVLGLSSRTESFGNVVVEALAYGLPVVATVCAGPKEILNDEQYGKLVPIGGEAALAEALDAALADPGDPAPRQARAAKFSLDKGVGQYAALIEGVLSR